MTAESQGETHTNNDESVLLADLAALHDRHARHVLGYAYALLGTRKQAEQASLEVLLTGWRAGLAQEADQRASRLLLMSLVRREIVVLLKQRAPTAPTLQAVGRQVASRILGSTS